MAIAKPQRQDHDRDAAQIASYEELDRFAAIAAHDLNAPLRQIGQVIGMMREDMAGRLEPEDVAHFEQIEQRAERLRRLVNGLLDYSRAANAPLSIERLCLDDVMEAARADLSPLIADKDAAIQIDPLPEIDGDPMLTQMLFQNLVSNAVQYAREGVSPQARIFTKDGAAGPVICVADNGVGVEPAMAERIFEPFAKVGGKNAPGGAGIGLAIVKLVVAKHGWTVSMDSKPDAGSTVSVDMTA